MPNNKYAVILAGGMGSRFWPLSRELEPKQFLVLNGNKSLFQQTIERILPIIQPERIYIIGNQQHKLGIEKQISFYSIPKNNIILEPEGKNTAPAIGLAAKFISLRAPESIMIVLPSDHLILNHKRFLYILNQAERLAQKDYLVTIGIKPDKPHTGYGYIKISNQKPVTSNQNAYKVERFIEKPNISNARRFFKDKRYFWNSGMFVWKTKIILKEIRTYLPALAEKLLKIESLTGINPNIWNHIEPISIDYGILEKAKRVAIVVAKNIGWSDLGSWSALAEFLPKDKNGNVIQGDSIDIGSKSIAIFANSRLIATIGLKDLIISDTQDALLVCNRSKAEEVKKIVRILNQNRRCESKTSGKMHSHYK